MKLTDIIPIQKAMDNLAAIALIDLNAPGPIGLIGQSQIITTQEEGNGIQIQWLTGEGSQVLLEVLDATFRSIHHYLFSLSQSPEVDWDDDKMLSGIAAMMALVAESADKMEKYLAFRLAKPVEKISERQEYRALQHFYQHYFSQKLKKEELHEVSDTELKDMDVVRSDREYELFYIRREDGRPYYRPELLRHMRIACSFDAEGENFEEDPILQIRAMNDRDLQASAKQIMIDCEEFISHFYQDFKRLSSHHSLAKALSFCLTALFLAANRQNLLQNTSGKTSFEYFQDFHRFLREVLIHPEYQKMVAYGLEEKDKQVELLFDLTHALCKSLFYRKGGIKQEMIALIFRTMRRGSEKGKVALAKEESFWSQLLRDDDNYRSLLGKFPSGPLLKILDLVSKEEEGTGSSFDPFFQGNLPHLLFQIRAKGKTIDILHLASPTSQSLINKVEIVDEFKGFLRSLSHVKKKHLLINLQDRTDWKEYPRSRVLETFQKNAEFHASLLAVTLPKSTDFYAQSNEYLNLNKAEDFIAAFEGQLNDPEGCGFFFPSALSHQELMRFTRETLPFIHTRFFEKKEILNRRTRENFIEIFYLFLLIKLIDFFDVTSISFTCKDGIDTGAAQGASLYAFIHLLKEGFSQKEDQDYLRWLFYAQALTVRERAIDPERFNRALSTLEKIEEGFKEHHKAVLAQLGKMKDLETI